MGPELAFVLVLLGGAVAVILFWGAAVAIALAIGSGLLLLAKGIWWVITRPIVWSIKALGWLFSGDSDGQFQPSVYAGSTEANVARDIHDRAERLSRLKALLDTNSISQAEYDLMKAEILG